MTAKSRGISAERELVHLLQEKGFSAIRIAGSGNTKAPSADVLAGNGVRIFAFECKILAGDNRYMPKEQICDFIQFARTFGAEPWLAIKHLHNGWKFVLVEDLKESSTQFRVDPQMLDIRGVLLEQLLM